MRDVDALETTRRNREREREKIEIREEEMIEEEQQH